MTVSAALHLAGAIGAGLMAGMFFAFSVFIMRALARVPAPEGIRAMQAINVTVITPVFLFVFMGTAVLGVVEVIRFIIMNEGRSVLSLAASLCYVIGTFGVTVIGNVPMNERLAKLDADEPDAAAYWQTYLRVWTRWNHVRTLAPTAALTCWWLA